MQKPPPATFCPPPVCACCRMRPRLTACYFYPHPAPLRLWASSASPCSTLSDRWTNPGVFGLFVDRMHKQPHATFCTPSACAFCRLRPRLTACCLFSHPAPLRLWASSASPCSTLSDRWTNPGVFGLFVDRMHKQLQPHATFCTHSVCAFGRTQPRVTPYCFYARSTPPRMRASLALPCSSLPDRRHATPQFSHPSIDTIPKKMPATSCIPPYLRLQPSTTAGCGMLVLHMFHTAAPSPTWSMHVPPVSANSHLPLLLLYPALHSVVVFSVHLPSTTGGTRTLSEGSFVAGPQRCRRRKRAVGGVGVKGLFADDESDWGLRRHAQKSTAHTTKHCAHRLRPHHWLAGSVSPKYNRKNNRFRFRLTISFGPCPPRTPQTLYVAVAFR